MPVEGLKAKRFRVFAGEYVMIVLSIVTALALENGVRHYHQAGEMQEAARNLDAELSVNLAEMRKVGTHNSEQLKLIKHLKKVLLADIKAGLSDKDAIKHIMAESGGSFGLSIQTPSLQHEAWDVAVANQALSFMPPDQLQRYARQYANMRDTQAVLMGSGNSFLNMPHLSDVISNLEMNELSAREMYRILTQIASVYETNGGNLRSLQELLLKEQKPAPKAAG